jgi:uncharacterized protein YbjQ (UPF0145 family)
MMLSSLSGNEIYCLGLKGFAPGNIVVGNSVQSLGFGGSIASGFRALAGGEVEKITSLIVDGRHSAIKRLESEAQEANAAGVTGVTSELKNLGGYKEFLALGSAIHQRGSDRPFFTTACSGQDLFCQIDAGYEPRHFVMGNVAYAMGVGRGVGGFFRTMAGGEVKQYSDIYNHTRHLALERIEKEARERGANAIVDIQTHILSFGTGIREMMMVGTASHHSSLGNPERPVTSELTGEELWNLTQLGYTPLRLLLGSSVYSLGFGGGVKAFFRSFSRGQVDAITKLVYEARENCLAHIQKEAEQIQADGVIGIKLFIYEISSGMVEVMAIGTAIRKTAGVKTLTEQLPPQAIIRDRDTYFDEMHGSQHLARGSY